MKTTFMVKTLEAAKKFQQGLNELGTASLHDIREYIANGKELPQNLKEKVDYLQNIRSEAIASEMYYLQAKAVNESIELPEDLVNGSALDPILEPAMYDVSPNFTVFELFQWFTPEEVANFVPRKIK